MIRKEELVRNKKDHNLDNANNQFRDHLYYASKEHNIEDIQVPLLSFGSWDGILLHLRGDVEGHVHAWSKFKYLCFFTGRHDLPFYYHNEIEVQ